MKKNEVLIVTMMGKKYNNNYGGVLQAYALYRFLKDKYGYDVKLLDIKPPMAVEKRSLKKKIIGTLKNEGMGSFLRKSIAKIKKKVSLLKKVEIPYELRHLREKKFFNFKTNYINFYDISYDSFEELKNKFKNTTDFPITIAGSDQIWNPFNPKEYLKIYLLCFIGKTTKISYSSSVSAPIPQNLANLYKASLMQFKAISVREKSSANYLKSAVGINAKIVPDPTLLLSKEQWNRIAKEPQIFPKSNYIFVYDLYRSKEIMPEVIKFAKMEGLDVLSYSINENSISFYIEGPREFLCLLKNSKYVVTSSFHGTIFSVLYSKNFVSVAPSKKSKGFLSNDRITDFLDTVGLKHRFATDPAKIKEILFSNDIDWKAVNIRMNEYRNIGIEFLNKTLKGGIE